MAAIPLLEFTDLSFERNDYPLFEGVSAHLNPGEILQIQGPNGCGKTTLLHILATLKMPRTGRVVWRGKSVSGDPSNYLSELAFIGHQSGLKAALTADENLRWRARLSNNQQGDVTRALTDLGVEDCQHFLCGNLSAGQQRRVAMAVLQLRQEAMLWLLDEPLTALDKASVAQLEQLCRAHLRRGGIIVFSSHQQLDLADVRQLMLPDYAVVEG